MNDENRYIQIMKDYESFLGIKLVNQQVEQLRQAREELSNIDNQATRDGSSGYGTNGLASTGIDRNSTASRGISQKTTANNIYQSQGAGVIDEERSDRIVEVEGSAMESMSSMAESVGGKKAARKKMNAKVMQQVLEQEGEDELIDHNNDNEADNNVDQKDEVVNNNKFNLSKLNLKENRKNQKKLSQKEIDDVQNAKTKDELENENNENQEVNNKIKMINAQAYKRRSTMIFSLLSIILILSTYFVIAYFLAMRTFQTAADVIVDLQSIFFKGSCFDSTMNFLRGSQIRNESLIISSVRGKLGAEQNKSEELKSSALTANQYYATEYYLDFCYQKEEEYNAMRVNPPKFFKSALSYIESMESSSMCDSIYVDSFAYLKPLCKSALNGIMSKGITNSFYFMFTQILKANLKFLDLGTGGKRTKAFLESVLRDETMIQIIDVKAKVLDPALNKLKQICMDSVISYI